MKEKSACINIGVESLDYRRVAVIVQNRKVMRRARPEIAEPIPLTLTKESCLLPGPARIVKRPGLIHSATLYVTRWNPRSDRYLLQKGDERLCLLTL